MVCGGDLVQGDWPHDHETSEMGGGREAVETSA